MSRQAAPGPADRSRPVAEIARRLAAPPVSSGLLLAAAAALSYAYADRNWPFQDEGATLTAAARILRGDVFYRDIDAYPFPGAPYLAAAAMAVFGEHLSVARALAGGLFCTWVVALHGVAVRLIGPARAALFGASLLAWKWLAWPAFTAYMYSDLAFAAGCVALALLLAGREAPGPARLAGAGVAVAVAVAAKQNLGLYLGAATTLALLPLRWPGRLPVAASSRPVLWFAGAAAVPLLAAAGWFAAQGLLGRLILSGLVRPFTGYLPTSGIAFAPMLAWWRLGELRDADAASYFVLDYFQLVMTGAMPWPAAIDLWWLLGEIFTRAVYTAVVVAAGVWGFRVVRGLARASETGERASPVLAFGGLALAMLASAFPRADFFHVISVAAPTALLLVAMFAPAERPMRRPRLALACVALGLSVVAGLAVAQRALLGARVEVARAAVDVAPENVWVASLVEAIEREVPADAPFFVYGHEAQLYFLTGRSFPWPFAQLYPGQVGRDGAEIVALLERDPPPLIVRGRQFWPGMPRPAEAAPRLDRWIRRHYVRDPDVFRRHPLPPGADPPLPQWMSLLRYAGDRSGDGAGPPAAR